MEKYYNPSIGRTIDYTGSAVHTKIERSDFSVGNNYCLFVDTPLFVYNNNNGLQ